jgi:hypothetical protein
VELVKNGRAMARAAARPPGLRVGPIVAKLEAFAAPAAA